MHRDAPSSASSEEDDECVPCYDICPVQTPKDLLNYGWASLITGIGQTFKGGIEEFRRKLIKYASKIGFNYMFFKNNKKMISIAYKKKYSDDCSWFTKASSNIDESVCIYKCNLLNSYHVIMIDDKKIKMMGCGIIVDLIVKYIRRRPSYSPIDAIDHMRTNYGIEISYNKAWRSVEKARKKIFGCYEESFQEL